MKPIVKKSYPIVKRDFIQAGTASIGIKNLLKSMGIDQEVTRRVAVCGYEGEMNAVMHGGDGQVTVEISDDQVLLDISDNGPGIEEKHFEKIFKIFQTLTSRDVIESSGIGLAVVSKVVRIYGGEVWVESQLGEGSTFFISWPKQEFAAALATVNEENTNDIEA